MSAKYILFKAKLKGEVAFLKGTRTDLSSKLSLTNEGNFNHYNSVYHTLSTSPVEIGNTLAAFKKK